MNKNEIYNDFIVEKITELNEIKCRLIELRDNISGATIMHIENEDTENVFCLSFKTLPENSHGTAHILEHTVLCGSEKFPVRDPFFSMKKRSLNTFMNAMTGSDFTCYPASSALEKDFYNLLEVYLDAVFHPKIDLLSFLQEGHRLEYNSDGVLENKGVVFNEMKGAMSSPFAIMWKNIMSLLTPDTPYRHDSGGDPQEIPNITYEELLNFHKKFYHPSRCTFFFYGNIPLKKHLDFIRTNALNQVQKLNDLPALDLQPRFNEPIKKRIFYPAPILDDLSQQNIISLSWLTCPISNQIELFALQILETILMGTDAAPLKRAILSSGLCHQIGSHIEDEIYEIPWVLFFQGCRAEDSDNIEKVVFDTLKTIVDKGFSKRQIEAAIHQHELQRSEITGDSAPYGLTLFMRSALIKQHGGEAESGLKIHSIFDSLRQELKQNNYFENLIKKYFINNTHYVRITMTPDKELQQREDQEEQLQLKKIEERLTAHDIKKIKENSAILEALQDEEERNTDCLPTITIADVPKEPIQYDLSHTNINGIDVYHHDTFTNDIIYADICCKIKSIPEDMLSYAKLYTNILPHLGCGNRGYSENLEYIQEHTGGIDVALSLCTSAEDFRDIFPTLLIEGKALSRKSDRLMKLYYDIINKPNFSETERIKELLMQHHTSLEQQINDNSMKYAINTACESLSEASFIGCHWSGLKYLRFMRNLMSDIDKNIPTLQKKFKELHQMLVQDQSFDLILSCDSESKEKLLRSESFNIFKNNIKQSKTVWASKYQLPATERVAYPISAGVAFTSQAFNTVPYTHKDSAALNVATHLLNNKTLHRRIREQGGAYGGGASCNTIGGKFYFYAYRDPNIASTLKAFQESLSELAKLNFNDRDLEEAKLEVFQKIDSPISPGSRAYTAYHALKEGITLEKRKKFREKLITLTRKDIANAVEKHLISKIETSPIASFAGEELIKKENKKMQQLLTKKQI